MKRKAIFDLIIIEYENSGYDTIKLYSRHTEKYCRNKAYKYIMSKGYHRLDIKQLIIVGDPDAVKKEGKK